MRVVIIEDNRTLANAIAYRLQDHGHAADILSDGALGDAFLAQEGADLVILDINLPSMNGLEIVQAMRARKDFSPILLLSARKEMQDRVTGLDLGADDYLVKPFEMDELEARVRALARRRNLNFMLEQKLGLLTFNHSTRQTYVKGMPIDMPQKERAVLECLLNANGQLTSKSKLADQLYGVGSEIDLASIEPHISRLRKRLEGANVEIKVARGLGYLLKEIKE